MRDLLAVVLAGGKGERLHPLTIHRAKPAVPFGGIIRIISGGIIEYDPVEDAKRFSVSPGGVVVIPKGAEVR